MALPDGLDEDTYKRALVFGKLAAKTYDYDDNAVAKIGMAFFSGIDDVKQQDFSTPNYKRIGGGGNVIDSIVGKDSGLDYTLYQEKTKDEKDGNIVLGDMVLAFRGTEPLSIEDWGEDIKQALSHLVNGTSSQYKEAIEIAMAMTAALKEQGKKLYLTGHSLGGGLASAAALATGNEAIVFDAAGVSRGTISHIKKLDKDVNIELNSKNIINFNVRECFVSDPTTPLGWIQDAVDTRQYGKQYWLLSVSERANFIPLPDWMKTVKIFESVLNHAWHVYTFQLEHMNFDPNEPLTYPKDDVAERSEVTVVAAVVVKSPPNKRKRKHKNVTPDNK